MAVYRTLFATQVVLYMNFHRGIMHFGRARDGCSESNFARELPTLMIVNTASRLSREAGTMAQIIIYITSK